MDEMKLDNDRIKTGINGLDNMLKGGLPTGSSTIIAGGPGAGKTLLCFETAYNNAIQGIPSLFISFEEDPQYLLKNIKTTFIDLALNIDKLMASKMLVVDGRDPGIVIENSDTANKYTFGRVLSEIEKMITDNKSKVVIIDSISLVSMLFDNDLEYRRAMVTLQTSLKKLNVTTLITIELDMYNRGRIRYTPEFFIFDGIVTLYMQEESDKRSLALEIFKMRGTNHSRAVAPYEITGEGMRVFTIES